MTNRTELPALRAVRMADTWRLQEAEAGSRVLDYLLSWLPGVLRATAPPTMGETIVFREASFGLDSRARAVLRGRSAMLRANPGIRVVIGGHTSRSGFTAGAMELAFQRVEALRAFLRSQGVEAARIDVALRGAGWFLVERPCRAAGEGDAGACLLRIADPQCLLCRN